MQRYPLPGDAQAASPSVSLVSPQAGHLRLGRLVAWLTALTLELWLRIKARCGGCVPGNEFFQIPQIDSHIYLIHIY